MFCDSVSVNQTNTMYEFTTTAEDMHAIAMELNEFYDAMREESINHQEANLN